MEILPRTRPIMVKLMTLHIMVTVIEFSRLGPHKRVTGGLYMRKVFFEIRTCSAATWKTEKEVIKWII